MSLLYCSKGLSEGLELSFQGAIGEAQCLNFTTGSRNLNNAE
jgi:hypothetical protein